MRSIEEQIRNKCRYFNGLMNKACDNGIEYNSVKVPDVRPIKIPCLLNSSFSGGECSHLSFFSEEEIAAHIKELIQSGERIMQARAQIVANITATGKKYGSIKCPVCGGSLNYTQADVNNHIWADCACGFKWQE